MKINEFSLSEALLYVQTQRPAVNPNSAFLAQLEQYEEALQKQRESKAVVGNAQDVFSGPSVLWATIPDSSLQGKEHAVDTDHLRQSLDTGSVAVETPIEGCSGTSGSLGLVQNKESEQGDGSKSDSCTRNCKITVDVAPSAGIGKIGRANTDMGPSVSETNYNNKSALKKQRIA